MATPAIQLNTRFEDDPRGGFASHATFLRAVMRAGGARSAEVVRDERLRARFVGSDAAAEPGYLVPRAFIRAAAGSDEQGGYADPYGGFLQPSELAGYALARPQADPTMGRTTFVPMTAPRLEIPARSDADHSTSLTGGLKFSRRPATIAATSSRLTLEQVVLSATSLTGLAYATEELLSASPSTFAAIIAAGFDDELGGTLLREKIRGVGGSEFLGVLGAPGTITVAAEGGQAADTITGANVMAMSKRCWGYSSAIWIANPDARSQLTQAHVLIEGSTGGGVIRLFQPAQAEGEPDRLDGRACFFSEHASALGDPGDLILGNWSQYLDGLYQPLQSAESVHVRFVEHERTLKFWVRNAGAPWWRSALTPAEGANTLSPFVVLEERS